MSCRMTSAISLLVVALLFSSLLTPHLPTACARHVVLLRAKDGPKVVKHGHLVGEEAGEVVGGSRPIRTVEMRAARKHRLDEMYDMLRRDYGGGGAGQPRPHAKRPIHNDEPLQEDEP